ncbi:MAG: hypothetical protein P1V20_21565 [Verrucomicrobiales bacterium]|nr:hypothetical protein [Verrucomicrobiales bacterium]
MALLSSAISALVMWFFIWLLMRKDGVVSLKPVLLICITVSVATYFALRFIGSTGMLIVFAFLIWSLIQWCFLSWPKAILVSLVWLATQAGFGLFVSPIF